MAAVTFGARTTALEATRGANLEGKVAIITGGASGIGKETARAFAHQKAHVILAVRDPNAVSDVVAELKASTKNDKIDAMQIDLSSLASVKKFANSFLERNLPLHFLLNNAGVMAIPTRKTTVDGFEMQFGTNHLGHFLLTNLLVPKLIESKPSRVVTVSSIAHRRCGINLDDLQWEKKYDKWEAYGQSKSANILFAKELNRRLEGKGVLSFSLHPGGIMTNLQRDVPQEEMKALGWMDENGKLHELFKTQEQGASTTVYAALAPELETQGGAYLEDCTVVDTKTDATKNMKLAYDLWEASEELVGQHFHW